MSHPGQSGSKGQVREAVAMFRTISAQDIPIGVSIGEGTVVREVQFSSQERWNPLTGEVARVVVATVRSTPARVIVVEVLPDGRHLHGYDMSPVTEQTFDYDEQVNVVQPAPMEPCSCGFPQSGG